MSAGPDVRSDINNAFLISHGYIDPFLLRLVQCAARKVPSGHERLSLLAEDIHPVPPLTLFLPTACSTHSLWSRVTDAPAFSSPRSLLYPLPAPLHSPFPILSLVFFPTSRFTPFYFGGLSTCCWEYGAAVGELREEGEGGWEGMGEEGVLARCELVVVGGWG